MIPNAMPPFDFGLGETADALRELVQRFSADQVAPIAAEIDKTDRFPRELWPKMGELGRNRRHLVGREALDLVTQRVSGLAESEVEGRHRVGDHCLGARSVLTLMLISFHSPSDGMNSRSNTTRAGSVGKWPPTSSRPSSATFGAGS